MSNVLVLLVNLGTPSAPTPKAVRAFLRDFLSDRRVIDLPAVLWQPILRLFVLSFRPRSVARNYQKVWTSEGSALMVIAQQQTEALRERLHQEYGGQVDVALAMTYGRPSIAARLDQCVHDGISQVIVLPLFPQYSSTTTAAVTDQLYAYNLRAGRGVSLRVIQDYHDSRSYIHALAQQVRRYDLASVDKILLSFHGIPLKYAKRGDPYLKQCQRTAQRLAEACDWSDEDWQLGFQSRFGPLPWAQPYVDQLLQDWPKQGIKRVAVLTPGFSADCLETLEEIALGNKELFLEAGGESYTTLPCLNIEPEHISMMAKLVAPEITAALAKT